MTCPHMFDGGCAFPGGTCDGFLCAAYAQRVEDFIAGVSWHMANEREPLSEMRPAAAAWVARSDNAPQALRQVGWLTQAGNVVTPTGHREQDAKLYGWRPVYALLDGDASPTP